VRVYNGCMKNKPKREDRVTILVTSAEKEALEAYAAHHQMHLAEVVREALALLKIKGWK